MLLKTSSFDVLTAWTVYARLGRERSRGAVALNFGAILDVHVLLERAFRPVARFDAQCLK